MNALESAVWAILIRSYWSTIKVFSRGLGYENETTMNKPAAPAAWNQVSDFAAIICGIASVTANKLARIVDQGCGRAS
jgi:hypothetical protein